jgi:alpha-beta hydrolase superfamily lysophospholipase
MLKVSFRKVDVDGFKIFYREAGSKDAPAILLLHGFPSASHMFRDLIPKLADRFHVIAPDLPGFGQSDMPDRGAFTYTFDNIARVVERLTEVVGSIAMRSTCSTMARQRVSDWQLGILNASTRSSHRTETLTWRA